MPRVAPEIVLDPQTRAELQRLVRAPSTPQALALRARLVLAAAQGLSNQQIAAHFHVTAITVGKWRTRFYMHGVSGLTDYQHAGRPPTQGSEVREKLRRLLRQPPPRGKERWTVRGLARELKMPPSTLHDMLVAAGFESRRRPVRRRPPY
jgi:putative transposase